MQREAANLAPDLPARLEATLRDGRRRGRRQQFRTALAFATVILGVVLLGPPVIDALRRAPVGASPSPTAATTLTGSYATTLASTDTAVTANRMQGDWTIGFGSSGILTVTTPSSFTGTRSGYSFQVTGDQFRTDLFGADVCSTLLPGTYQWNLVSGQLTFILVDDTCPGRVALLTSASWSAIAPQ
jgi:hypothetical protein